LVVDVGAQVPADRHGGAGAEVESADRRRRLHERDQQHPAADPEDVVGVAAGDAVVDDVGVEAGEVQRRQGADELQRHDGGDEPAVSLEMGAEKARQHQRASPFNRIEASWSADIRDSAEVPGCHIPKTRLRSTSAASWGVTRSSSAWGANTWSA